MEEFDKGALRHSQDALNQKLGIDFKTFSRSVIMGQNIVTNFLSGGFSQVRHLVFDLSLTSQRREIIEEMLGLEKLQSFWEEAKRRRNESESKIKEIQSEIRSETNHLESLKEGLFLYSSHVFISRDAVSRVTDCFIQRANHRT